MNNIYDMYIMLCLNSWIPLFSFKLTHEKAKSLRQINSLDTEMYCLNSHKGRHARPRHGRVKEYTRPNHGRVDAYTNETMTRLRNGRVEVLH